MALTKCKTGFWLVFLLLAMILMPISWAARKHLFGGDDTDFPDHGMILRQRLSGKNTGSVVFSYGLRVFNYHWKQSPMPFIPLTRHWRR